MAKPILTSRESRQPETDVLIVHAQPIDLPGGAELSLTHYINHAPANIRVHSILPDERIELANYDAVIIANLRPNGGLGEDAEYAWADAWSARLRRYRGFAIRQEHDTHPCTYRDARCFRFNPLIKLKCECNFKITGAFERLYNACSAVQFVSPMQQALINLLIDIETEQVTIAPPVDLSRFTNRVPFNEREPTALIFSDPLRTSSGATVLAEQHGFTVKTVDYLSVPYEEMPATLNSVRAVVLHPTLFHACPRLAIEAEACGCKVLTNELVGSTSWPDPVAASRQSNEKFWSLVQDGASLARDG
jgi:glycosyltransferase involved in cell wall biosynthesis